MKAAVLLKTGEPLEILDVDLESPGPSEVTVRLAAAGICASDWHTITGDIPSPIPTVLGHEGAGVVEAVGEGVTSLEYGDHVVLNWLPACQSCRFCQSGRPNLCTRSSSALFAGTLVSGARRLSYRNKQLHHYSFLSTFAERTVVDEASCVRIPRDIPLPVAALVGCAVMTGYGAVVNRARVRPGSTVVIIGTGGVGLSSVMAASLSGARKIVAIEPAASKRQLALQLGATHAFAPDDQISNRIDSLTDREGADVTIEAAGRPDLVRLAWDLTSRGGTIVCVGVPPVNTTVHLPGPELVRHEKVVTGCLYGSCRPQLDIPAILALFADGHLPLDRLVSATYRLDEVNNAFDDLNSGRLARGVISFEPHLSAT